MAARKKVSHEDFNGLKGINLGAPDPASNDAARAVDVEAAYEAARSRANHTGTQTANTVSDFDTAVRTSRLDQMAAPTAAVSLNNQRLTSVGDPSTGTDGANKNYVDTTVAGLVSGQVTKGAVEVFVSTNVTISNPGTAVFDGITISNGQVVLLAGQSTGTENGPYVFNGSGSAMTRAANWDSDAEAVLGSYWVIKQGTYADRFALLTNDSAITLGTSTPAFITISSATSIVRYEVTCPAVSAGATWTVTHNMGTRSVHVMVQRVASPYDFVDVYAEATTVNTVSIKPDIALASGEFNAVVKY